MPNNNIKFNVGFNVDQTGLNKIKTSLQSIQNLKVTDLVDTKQSTENLEKLKNTAKTVQEALEDAYNPKLDTTNLEKFNTTLKSSGLTVNEIQSDFAMAGETGAAAFRDLTTEILTTNLQLKESHNLLDSMAKTLGNTIKWTLASGAINKFTGSIQKAYSYAKSLDESLNNIQIVTQKSSDTMASFAKQANKAAQSLGASTTDYTDAALIYYQQGLSDKEVETRTDITMKVANVTKQSADEVSEQLTAVWNGYQVSANEAELYIDKLAAVAANSASSLEELSTAMSKVASAASAMGVDIDQLTAQISTIESVTRQDAASVGTALKTIYARMGDLAVEGEDEFGVALGTVSGQLKTMGIDVLDQMGNLRDMGDVMEEVAAKWGTWTEAQQQAAAVALAGKRQYNNLIALFNNWDKYTENLEVSKTSEGTLEEQQEIYMQSLEAHLNELSAAGEKVYSALFDTDSFKDLLDVLTALTNQVATFIDAIGGGGNLLLAFGSIATRVFSKQLSDGIATYVTNIKGAIDNNKQLAAQEAIMKEFDFASANDESAKELIAMKQQELKIAKSLTTEEKQQFDESIKQTRQAQQLNEQLVANKKEIQESIKTATGQNLNLDSTNKNRTKDIDNAKFDLQEASADINKKYKKDVEETQSAVNNLAQAYSNLKQEKTKAAVDDTVIQSYQDEVQQLDETRAKIKEQEQELSNLKQTRNELNESSFTSEDTISQIETLDAKIKEQEQELSNLKNTYNEISNNVDDFSQKYPQLTQAIEDYNESVDKNNITLDEAVNSIQEVIDKKLLLKEGQDEVTKALIEYKNILEKFNQGEATQADVLKAAEKLNKKYKQALTDTDNQYKKNIKDLDTLEKREKDVSKATKDAKNNFNALAKAGNLKNLINNVVSAVGAVGQLASAIQVFQNIGSIWKNSDLSTGEKVLQTVEAAASGIAMLTSALQGLHVIQGIGAVIDKARLASKTAEIDAVYAEVAAKDWENLKDKEGNALKTEEIALRQIQALAQSEEINALLEKNGIKANELTLENQENLQRAATILGLYSETAGYKVLGKAGTTAGSELFAGGVMAQLGWWPLLLIGIALAAVVGTVIAAFAIFNSIDKRTDLEKATEAYDAATESLTDLKTVLSETQDAYEDLQDSISDYKDAQLAIEELKVGTDEWKKAIQDSNEIVLDLLSNYAELSEYVSNVNGQLILSQEGQDYILAKQQEIVNQTQRAVYAQQVAVYEAANKVQDVTINNAVSDVAKSKFARALNMTTYEQLSADEQKLYKISTVEGGQGRSYKAATLDTNTITNLVSAAIDEKGNAIFSSKSAFVEALNEQGLTSEKLISALWDEKDTLKNSINAIDANTKAVSLYTQQYAASDLASLGDATYNAASTNVQNAIAKSVGYAIENTADKYNVDANSGDSKKRTENRQAVAQEWAEQMGYSNVTYHDDEKMSNGNKKVTYVDANGVSREISINSIYDQMNLAAASGAQVTADNVDQLVKLYTTIEGKSTELVNLQNKQAVSFSETSKREVESLNAVDILDYQTAGYSSADAMAKALGFDSASDYENYLQLSQANFQHDLDEIRNDLTGSVAEVYDTLFKESWFADLSSSAMRNVSDALEQAFKTGGSDGLAAMQKLFEDFSSDPDTVAAIADVAEGIDWTSIDAVNDFVTQMKTLGIEVDLTDSRYSDFITSMQKSASVTQTCVDELDSLIERLANIKDIAGDIKTGDIIDEDDYKTLLAYNTAIADLFIRTADGYKYIGDSSNTLTSTLKSNLTSLEDVKADFETTKNESKALQDEITSRNIKFSSKSTDMSYADIFKNYTSVLKTAGIREEQYEQDLKTLASADKDSDIYQEAMARIQELYAAADTQLTNYTLGLYDSSEAQELWATEIANSVEEVDKAFEEGKLDLDVYQKAHKSWMQDEINDLGLSTKAWEAYSDAIDKAFGSDYSGAAATKEKSLAALKAASAATNIDLTTASQSKIDTINRKITEAQRQANKVTGQASITNLEQQLTLETELKTATEDKITAQQKSLDIQQAALDVQGEELKSLGFTNLSYENIQEKYLELSQLTDEESQAQAEILKEYLDQYDVVQGIKDEVADTVEELNDVIDTMESLALEKWEAKIQLEIDTKQAEKDFYEFIQKTQVDEDDYLNQANLNKAQLLTYYNGTSGSLLSNLNAYKEARAAYNAFTNTNNGAYITSDFANAADAEAAMKEYLEAAKDDAESFLDLYQSIEDNYISALDKVSEEFDKQQQNYENLQKRISHDINMVKLLNGDKSYSELDKYYKSQQELYQQTLNSQVEQANYWSGVVEELKILGRTDTEEYETAKENALAAIEEVNSTEEEMIENLQEKFSNSIKALFSEYETGNMDILSEKWSYLTDQSERYFDTINRSYEIQKVANSFDDALESTKDNISAQRKLNQLKEKELSILEQRGKLTQYDIDRANAQLELELKRIELEEAQQNATKMKLVRDANGNYSYQFVSDTDKTSQLEQEIADLENSLYNLDKDEWKSRTDEILEVWSEFTDKMSSTTDAELLEQYYQDYMGSDGIITNLLSDVNIASGNLTDIVSSMAGYTGNMSDYIAGFDTYTEFFDKLTNMDKASVLSSLNDLTEEYSNSLKNITTTVSTLPDVSSDLYADNTKIIESAEASAEAILTVVDSLKDLEEEYQKLVTELSELEGSQLGINADTVLVSTTGAGSISIGKFDTGGYTGSWGSDGKLAVLHEKELVLNADDTENMLSLIDMTRSITSQIAGMALGRASGLLDNIDATSIKNAEIGGLGTDIQQTITIEANFPDAVDRDEIQAAFDSLVSLANQKAGLNNRM
jgi:TP901 family phage tail tape measure protein